MVKYRVRYSTQIEVTVVVEAADEDEANELAAVKAEDFAEKLSSDDPAVTAAASFDGVGYHELEPVT